MADLRYTVKFILTQKKDKSKLTSLRCFIRYNNTRCVFASGVSIEPRYWNGKAQEPKKLAAFSDAIRTDIVEALELIRTDVKAVFRRLVEFPAPDDLKELYQRQVEQRKVAALSVKKKAHSLTSYISQLIEDTKSGKRLKPGGKPYQIDTLKHYKSALGVITRYAEFANISQLDFNAIDQNFYDGLKEFCYSEGLSTNYFGIVIKVLKTAMSEAEEQKLHNNKNYKSRHFIRLSLPVDNVYMNVQQLEQIEKAELNEKLAKVRDLFLVGCWTGLRFSDFTNIMPENIDGDMLHIKVKKTGEMLTIPIHEAVQRIMAKYAGKTFNSLPPALSNQKMNAYLKEMCEAAGLTDPQAVKREKGGKEITDVQPFYALVSTHTARRSFATNMFRMGIPSLLIMGITGHRSESSFLKYIKASSTDKAELIKQAWQRQKLKAG